MIESFFGNLVHVLLFAVLLASPLFVKKEYGNFFYYYALFLLVSWGVNDGSCILTSKTSKNDKIQLNNGATINLINDLGIKTNKLANYLIRLTTVLLTAYVMYFYSSKSTLQKLITWCLSWNLFTVETLRFVHINHNGMEANSFKGFMRKFKRENLNIFKSD